MFTDTYRPGIHVRAKLIAAKHGITLREAYRQLGKAGARSKRKRRSREKTLWEQLDQLNKELPIKRK